MARSKRRFFWHVPLNAWLDESSGTFPSVTGGIANVGVDIVVPLVDTNLPLALESDVPERDEFVVERVIGQYRWTSNEATGVARDVAHRIYPVTADASSVALRNLWAQDDAESDFLWHKVEPDPGQLNLDEYGSWGWPSAGGIGFPSPNTFMGRFGHLDVKVGRRLREGEALIWHSQFSTNIGAGPADNTKYLQLWVRVLVREG